MTTGCPAFAGHDKTNLPLRQARVGGNRGAACRAKLVAPANVMAERTVPLEIRKPSPIGCGQDRETRRIERHPVPGKAVKLDSRRRSAGLPNGRMPDREKKEDRKIHDGIDEEPAR